jgi:hypothetical protein
MASARTDPRSVNKKRELRRRDSSEARVGRDERARADVLSGQRMCGVVGRKAVCGHVTRNVVSDLLQLHAGMMNRGQERVPFAPCGTSEASSAPSDTPIVSHARPTSSAMWLDDGDLESYLRELDLEEPVISCAGERRRRPPRTGRSRHRRRRRSRPAVVAPRAAPDKGPGLTTM